jgi:hypothetical protein
MSEDTPSTEALTPDEERDEATAALLERIGYFWGGSYLNDPNEPTWGWLRSDGAGNATPVTDPEQALIDHTFAERAVRQEAADTSGHLHLDYSSGGSFCPLDDCLCECHLPDLSSAVLRQEAADPSGLPRALHMAWTQSGGDYYYGDMFWEKVVARITDVEAALAAGATERPLPEVADTIGHGPCDYNGGPGSDQCPHGVFAPQGDDDA